MTKESNLHPAYKDRALTAAIDDTTLIGRGRLPIRVLRNEFTRAFEAALRSGAADEQLATLAASRTLEMAAIDGDIEQGKVEVGQCVGLIDDLPPAAVVVERLMVELEEALEGLCRLRGRVEES